MIVGSCRVTLVIVFGLLAQIIFGMGREPMNGPLSFHECILNDGNIQSLSAVIEFV